MDFINLLCYLCSRSLLRLPGASQSKTFSIQEDDPFTDAMRVAQAVGRVATVGVTARAAVVEFAGLS